MKIWVTENLTVPTFERVIVNTQRMILGARAVDMKHGLWGFTGSKTSNPILTHGPHLFPKKAMSISVPRPSIEVVIHHTATP